MINKALFTSNKEDWETPQYLFDELDKEFDFDIDVCADDKNCKVSDYFSKELNGLNQSWGGQICWLNPPYGRKIGEWVKKAYEESQKGATVVCLLPSRTCTRWFHDYCLKGEVRFIKGRFHFSNTKWNAPFPSMIVVFRP